MKKLLTISFLSTKLGFLLCFGLMGNVLGTESTFAENPPCHVEINTEQDSTKDCEACVLSEEVWSHDFVVSDNDFTTQEVTNAIIVSFEDLLNQEKVVLIDLSKSDPPDKIAVLHSHLIFQKGIVLVV